MSGIALYLRLSHADMDLGKDDKEESNSIENQRELLRSFLEARDDIYGEVFEFVDDGYTGTNFDRPAFTRMIEEAKAGKIKTILCKDLSRLGRDYIGVGDYLEQIFPALGVRFIAVNSNYDSKYYEGKTSGIDVSLTNLINSLYSKDLSKKTKSAKIAKWKKGIPTAGKMPFGYVRDYSEPHKWIIDEEAAAVVRDIFHKAAKGWKTKEIVEHLNEQKILIPSEYRKLKYGEIHAQTRTVESERLWNTSTVWRVLKNYAYTGCIVQGKFARVAVCAPEQRKVPERDRYYIEGAAPAIISKEMYFEAQEVIKKQKQKAVTKPNGFLLTGKVRCGNCGLNMVYKGKYEKYIYCQHASSTGSASTCSTDDYAALMIEGQVRYAIFNQLHLLLDLASQLKEKTKQKETTIHGMVKDIKARLAYLNAEKIRQYESYANGHLERAKYMREKDAANEEIKELTAKLEAITADTDRGNQLQFEINRVESRAARFLGNGELTREIVEAFIDVVYVHNRENIEIRFNFDDIIERTVRELEA